LAPLQILNPGSGYHVNDIITITGTPGSGANAYVTGVNASGAIMNVAYTSTYNGKANSVIPGGSGYLSSYLPTVTVSTASGGSGASLAVPGILGQGATFNYSSDTTGRIKTISVLYAGEDYQSTPQVSLQVHDIIVTGFGPSNLPKRGDVVYQGASFATSTYYATVDSITLVQQNYPLSTSNWKLRVYNPNSYTNIPSTSQSLTNGTVSMNVVSTSTYGDGSALASATILSGTVKGKGQYVGTKGQVSSFSVLQNEYYNNYTYEISVKQTISKYRDILLNLLHPSGTNVFGKYSDLQSNTFFTTGFDDSIRGNTLYHFTQVVSSNVTASADFTTYSTNIINFNNLAGQNLANFISTNSYISIINSSTQEIFGQITSINTSSNSATISSNVWLTFGNVAIARGTSGFSNLNISSVYTNSYNIINNGVYTVPSFPLLDIIYSGDRIKVSGCTSIYTITSIGWSAGDYSNTNIYVTPSLGSTLSGNITVSRTFSAGGSLANTQQVRIYNAVYGTTYLPQLTTELYELLTDESNNVLYIT
jgi:hypothetical protein